MTLPDTLLANRVEEHRCHDCGHYPPGHHRWCPSWVYEDSAMFLKDDTTYRRSRDV